MCHDCLVEERPDRETVCLDKGHYLLNFKGCKGCGSRGDLVEDQRKVSIEEDDSDSENEEYEEETTFFHKCKKCGHVVCEHFHRFQVNSKTQEWLMECFLCGKGADTIRLGPRRASQVAVKPESELPKFNIGTMAGSAAAAAATVEETKNDSDDEWED